MRSIFYTISAVAAVVMVVMILLQQQSSGLGASFGGDSGSFRTKRGAEKVVFNVAVVSAIIFVLSLILGLLSKV